jgi:hypothetical protein
MLLTNRIKCIAATVPGNTLEQHSCAESGSPRAALLPAKRTCRHSPLSASHNRQVRSLLAVNSRVACRSAQCLQQQV